MRKQYGILILAVLFSAACKTKPSESPVKNITIKYTELGRETLFKIACGNFERYFPEAHVKNLTKKEEVDAVMNTLTAMKDADQDAEPDVRSKIFIAHENNAIDTVCVGIAALRYKDHVYETPQELLKIIQQ
jgi:PBP1b-binding outer membrane lipoprotein LpoB